MLMASKEFFLVFVFLIEFLYCCNGQNYDDDLHSSVTALVGVLNTEKSLIQSLANFITGSQEKVDLIKNFINGLKNDHDKLLQEGISGQTIDDPLHAFKLTKRLSVNVPRFQDDLNKTTTLLAANFTKISDNNNLPNSEDLVGVTLGLLRVQEVYGITAEQIADGILSNINFGSKFTASDCFEVALKLKELGYSYYAIDWFKMTLKRIEEEGWKGITPKISEMLVYDFLAFTQYLEGSVDKAKAAIETSIFALSKKFDDTNAVHVASNLKSYIDNYLSLKKGDKEPTSLDPPLGTLARHNITEMELLKKGCRGELKKSPKEERELFCKYETKNHPFLLIAPIKIEVLNLSPQLVVAHDVMYDSEIEKLKKISLSKLTRAGVWNQAKGTGERSLLRTSKFAWLQNETDPVLHTLNQRVSDITGLTMETAEEFQLMNYGIGGHYDIHPDYFTEPTADNGVKPYGMYDYGNRVATVLFYMSDVPLGGGTVWPNINVLTLPKKGTAAFWYNMFADESVDSRSRHSACPIIAGSKWVANKWIRMRGQEFRRPCYTYPDHLGKPKN